MRSSMIDEMKEKVNSIKIVKDAYEYMEMVLREDYPGWEIKAQCEITRKLWEEDQFEEDCKYYFDWKKMKIVAGLLKLLNFATGFVRWQVNQYMII